MHYPCCLKRRQRRFGDDRPKAGGLAVHYPCCPKRRQRRFGDDRPKAGGLAVHYPCCLKHLQRCVVVYLVGVKLLRRCSQHHVLLCPQTL